MGAEPIGSELGDLLEGAALFEEVGGVGDDAEFFDAGELFEGGFGELKHHLVLAADDKEDWAVDFFEGGAGEVGAASAGDDGQLVLLAVLVRREGEALRGAEVVGRGGASRWGRGRASSCGAVGVRAVAVAAKGARVAAAASSSAVAVAAAAVAVVEIVFLVIGELEKKKKEERRR